LGGRGFGVGEVGESSLPHGGGIKKIGRRGSREIKNKKEEE